MVRSTHFFDDHPAILSRCLEVNREINDVLGKKLIAENAVTFDVIVPFLIEDIGSEEARLSSKELRLHREVVDYYNMGVPDVRQLSEALTVLRSIPPITYSQYQSINSLSRRLINYDLISSYIISTERVYYRFQILDRLSMPLERKSLLIQNVREFSAFLLFDDDVYDLESDIANEKSTILTQFLRAGNHLSQGIAEMTELLKDGSNLFAQFTNCFKEIYQECLKT